LTAQVKDREVRVLVVDDDPAAIESVHRIEVTPIGVIGLAERLGRQVRESTDFELLEEPGLNVVCFRCRPRDVPEAELDDLNRRVGQAVIADGRVYFGTTVYAGKVAFRPAISNYRTTERDIDLILPVTRELVRTIEPVSTR